MAVDFSGFDKRGYPVVSVETGYAEWADRYDETVAVGLDRPLLESLTSVAWDKIGCAVDLACGTGRTGAWLKSKGVTAIDGIDVTQAMLDLACEKAVYRQLLCTDLAATPLPSSAYDLAIVALADEHLAELEPLYREAARLLVSAGNFVLIGYHPFFLMKGMPTHYHRNHEEAITIQSYVHLFSEHFESSRTAGLSLKEFRECIIDESWLETKPKWREHLNWPVSFALVWEKTRKEK